MSLSRGDRVLWAVTGCGAVALAVLTAISLRQSGAFDRLRQAALERPRVVLPAAVPGEEGPPGAQPTTPAEAEAPAATPVPAMPERIFFTAAALGVPTAEAEDHVDLWAVPAEGGSAERIAEGVRAMTFTSAGPWTMLDSDGRPRLVYIAGTAQSMSLEALDLRSGQTEELYPGGEGQWIVSPAASPDGERLAFITLAAPSSGHSTDDMYGTLNVLTTDGGRLEREFERAALWATPRWSPDSRWLAAVEEGGGTRWPRLTLLPAGEGEPLTPPFDRAWLGVWAPRGQRVIAVCGQPSGGVELVSWDVATGEHETLALEGQEPGQLAGVIWDLAWSPDGEWLAGLAGDDWDELALYVVPRESGAPLALYGEGENEGNVGRHAWSPDSRHIAFMVALAASEAGGETPVNGFVVQPDGQGLWQANLGLEGSVNWMDWSPDGQHLAFALNSGQDEEMAGRLYVVDVNEQRQVLLSEGTGPIYTLRWIPSIAGRG